MDKYDYPISGEDKQASSRETTSHQWTYGREPINSFQTSGSTAKLDLALAKAQGEIEAAVKDAKNPHFKSVYASLLAVIEASRPALAKYEISVTQWPRHSDDDRVHLITRVAHADEWMLSDFSCPVTKKDPQGYGSAITYLRRYSWQSILGIPSEDDDANAGSGKGFEVNTKQYPNNMAAELAHNVNKDVNDSIKSIDDEKGKQWIHLFFMSQNDLVVRKRMSVKLSSLVSPLNQAFAAANGDQDEIKRILAKLEDTLREAGAKKG